MSLKISNEELKQGRSGTRLRFSVHLFVDAKDEVGAEMRGWLAFRAGDGELVIKPPTAMLNLYGKRIKYPIVLATPGLVDAVKPYIEEQHGKKLKADPDWQGHRAELKRKQQEIGWYGG